VAALTPKPRDRVHFAVKFAAGAMRIASVLVALGSIGGAVALFNLPRLGVQALPDLVAGVIAAVVVVFALIYALILWGFADGLVLLADVDDAQRATQRQLADLVLAQRTARGPFHSEMVAEKTAQAGEETALRP